MTLDDFSSQMEIYPEVVKIDVEGAEALVIGGMTNMMQAGQPAVMVELHSWHNMTVMSNAEKILGILDQVNYQMIYLRNKEVVRNINILNDRGRCHVLLLPNGQSCPDWLSEFDTSKL